MYFKQGSEGDFDYVNLSYSGHGGDGFGDYVGIENDGGILNIRHSNIHNNYKIISNGAGGSMSAGNGILNKSGTLSVSDSVIDNNVVGIRVDSGTTTIFNNAIKNNVDSTGYSAGYGIYAYGLEPLTLLNNIFSGNRRTAYVDASKDFTHSNNTSNDQTNKGFEINGYITSNATLSGNDLPFIIGSLTVNTGGTLTLEPGAIIKMNDYYSSGAIYMQGGNLIARGTPEKKIYITSLKDDSAGGDTNGDGNATTPAPKNWSSIFLENGSKAEFDNVTVRYGGYNYCGEYLNIAAAIYQRGAEFSASNSVFEHNSYTAIFQDAGTTTIAYSEFRNQNMGIWFRGGSINILQSSLHDNSDHVIYNQGSDSNPALVVDARHNWWGDPSGPHDISTTTPTGTGDRVSGDILYIPFLTEPPGTEQRIDPVIIIPGIVGTELYNGDDLIWLDLWRLAYWVDDYFLTENLSLSNEGGSINNIQTGDIIKDKEFLKYKTDIFGSLIQDITANNYQENQNLFLFPYDWRLDLDETKNLLNKKIEDIKLQTGKSKVNIIAHSMGGLLTKAYLNSYGKEDIGKLIFIGTPHLGAPKAGKILLEGDRLGIPWLEEDRIQEIAENSPALHELLPNQTYFNEFQGYFRKYKLFGDNPLMNYGETKDFFLNKKDKNSLMFQKAEDFYSQSLDDFNFSGIEAYNITGCKTSTQAAYSFDIFGEIGQTGYTSGDGTVPMVSADHITIPSQNKFYVKDGNHAELPSTNGVKDLILGILNDNTANLAGNISNNFSFCNFKGKKLTWHSPVEIHVYSGGSHTGPIENNAIEYGIPGIDYDVMSHNKFIFLPTDEGQEYRVEAKGLEEGSFDLSISEVENGQYLTTQIFNDVPVDTSSTVDFVVSDSIENNIIELENQGEKEEIAADTVLEGDLILDLIPPETEIILTGKKYKNGELKKGMEISFASTDEDSGILGMWYSLDGQNFIRYADAFTLDKKEMYKIYYFSVDKAGNNEEVKQKDIIIGKLDKYLRKLE